MTLVTEGLDAHAGPVPDAPAADTPAEGAPAADTPAEGEGAKAPEGDAGKAPEGEEAPSGDQPIEYTDFTVPEGVELNEAALGSFKDIATELKLKQEGAQKLVDQAVSLQQEWAQGLVTEVAQSGGVYVPEPFRVQFREQTKTDREIGGAKLAENLATAKRGLEAYGSPALNDMLNRTGLGDHPELIRFFVKAGKTVSEDTYVAGKAPTNQGDRATRMYPTSASKE